MAETKPALEWTHGYHVFRYAAPNGSTRGRVVPLHNPDGTENMVIAHVWGPDAVSEATEDLTLEDGNPLTPGALVEKARLWVEERVKALDTEGSLPASRP